MASKYLSENLTFDQAKIITEFVGEEGNRSLFMKGICIQGGVKNANQRIYPVDQISGAINQVCEQLKGGYSVLGEIDHPDNLRINLDRVSHMITEMWLDGPNGFGKLKILPTPMGNLVKTMLESGVKLGVSSRGSGDVNESNGMVSNFEIVTVDVVAQPSAPSAYPTTIYEGLMNMRGGYKLLDLSREGVADKRVQKHVVNEVKRLINELKL